MTLLNLLNTFSLSLSAPIGVDNHDFIGNNESIIDDTETNNQNINLYSINADLDIQEPLRNVGISDGVNGGYVSDSIEDGDLENWLNANYPDYCCLDGTWKRINSDSANTADLTNAIPLEINHNASSALPFNDGEIQQAIINANVSDNTNYGGCGPIAIMAVMDYFARYLGFNFFNPNDSLSRIDLATRILKNTIFSIFGDVDNSFVWPGDVVKAFNSTLDELGCNNLRAKSDFSLLSGNKDKFLKNIKKSIKNGIPVTIATGLRCGEGDFAEHYPNIYGYETWVGHSKDGQIKTKVFLKGRLNWGYSKEYFCDADILDCAQIGIITYSFEKKYSMTSYDFSSLVNSSGQGQYFFGPSSLKQNVVLNNNIQLQTERIRTSFIESKYLVMSPNRKNAGLAFLRITFPHYIDNISFSLNMWSPKEGSRDENFYLNYGVNGGSTTFSNELSVPCYVLPTSKILNKFYYADFSLKVKTIEFVAIHDNPNGDQNRGRICLDNITVSFSNNI